MVDLWRWSVSEVLLSFILQGQDSCEDMEVNGTFGLFNSAFYMNNILLKTIFIWISGKTKGWQMAILGQFLLSVGTV